MKLPEKFRQAFSGVSLAAPRLRREGVPVGATLPDADHRLYDLLSRTEGDRAHARYLAWLDRMASFADACRYRRLPESSAGLADTRVVAGTNTFP